MQAQRQTAGIEPAGWLVAGYRLGAYWGAVIDSLINAILASQTNQVAALVRQGAPVDGLSRHGSTPLYMAAVQGEAEIVGMLLEAGADPNKESAGESEGTRSVRQPVGATPRWSGCCCGTAPIRTWSKEPARFQ
jgi:ankyrin repeat protein